MAHPAKKPSRRLADANAPRRVALYLRVSTNSQTVENQRLDLEAWAERAGHEVVQVYEDAGISGTKDRDQRPGLDQMLKDAARRRFDMLAVWSADRLGRSAADAMKNMNELRECGVDLFLSKNGIDTSTAGGRGMFQMLAVFAEMERELIVERVHAGLDRAKAQGIKLGRPRVAEDVQVQVRDLLAQGVGKIKIGRQLGIGTNAVQRIAEAMKQEDEALAA